MSVFGDPMSYFNAGKEGGAANSSAIGMAINDIVKRGEAVGLVQQQAYAQGMAAIPGQILRTQEDNSPIDQWIYDPITGETTSFKRAKSSEFTTLPMTEAALELSDQRKWEAKKASEAAVSPQTNVGAPVSPPASTSAYFSNSNMGAPAPAPALPSPGGLPTKNLQGQMRSPEFQNIDPSVFRTPEGQQMINDAIKRRLGGM